MSNKRLEIQGLRKSLSGREIIKGIDLNLYEGEVLGLIGPNGAGKTTTIKMITGLYRKDAGKIYYEGQDYDDSFIKIKNNIGAIVENPDLFPFLSGREHLKQVAILYPGTTDADIDRVAHMLNLDKALDKKVKQYSLGMKQRLGIACMLLAKNNLLILDEPFNGLDPQGIRDLRKMLRDLAEQEGITVMVSSHILSEVQSLCDRIAMINQGEIVAEQKVSDISDSLLDNNVKITTNDQKRLKEYFDARKIPSKADKEAVVLACELNNINMLLKDLMEADFKIYSVEPVHKNLEDMFIEIMQEKGGEIL